MATNPMQRQARNSFLLGMVITLLIAGVIVGFLFWRMNNISKELQEKEAALVKVYVLNQDVASGQTITGGMFSLKEVDSSTVPKDATNNINAMLATYSLSDKSGNNIYTDSEGLYMQVNGSRVAVSVEDSTGEYYTMNGQNKNYIETTQKPLIAKVGLKANTVITSSLIARSDEINTNDVREQEYNMLALPTDLADGDYVDVRFMLPNGQDFIVLSKKLVTIPLINGEYSPDIIKLNLSEDETLSMSSAIVEAYRMEASKLYVTKYAEAGLQSAATPTYMVNAEVANLIEANPNIVKDALNALRSRYNTDIRNQYINNALSTYGDDTKVTDRMKESITSTKEAREEYLQSIGGSVSN